jgi:hypothetical protein
MQISPSSILRSDCCSVRRYSCLIPISHVMINILEVWMRVEPNDYRIFLQLYDVSAAYPLSLQMWISIKKNPKK